MRTQQPGSLPEYDVDPYQLLEDDLKDVYSYIKQVSWIIAMKCQEVICVEKPLKEL